MTGIEPSNSSLRFYSQDSALANGEFTLSRDALGKPLRVVDADGFEVGIARFDAPVESKWETCTLRGESVESVSCALCRGNVAIKIFPCSAHGKCHLSVKPVAGVRSCRQCKDAV